MSPTGHPERFRLAGGTCEEKAVWGGSERLEHIDAIVDEMGEPELFGEVGLVRSALHEPDVRFLYAVEHAVVTEPVHRQLRHPRQIGRAHV